jgi:hypothetical protein
MRYAAAGQHSLLLILEHNSGTLLLSKYIVQAIIPEYEKESAE